MQDKILCMQIMKLQWLVIPSLIKSGFKGLNTRCCDNFFKFCGIENSMALQLAQQN